MENEIDTGTKSTSNMYAEALSARLRTLEDTKVKHELSGNWYPAQLGGCDRANILQHIGAEAIPPDDESLRLFWMGNRIHEALQSEVPFEVIGHEDDFEMRDADAKVSGRPDSIIGLDGTIEVVEFKSTKSESFPYLPDPAHILQVGCYLSFPITRLEDGLIFTPDRGRLVYWSKTDAAVKEFVIEPSMELEYNTRSAIERLENLYQRYLNTKELPEAQPKDEWRHTRRNKAKRTYCQFYGTGQCCGDPRGGQPVRLAARDSSDKSGV